MIEPAGAIRLSRRSVSVLLQIALASVTMIVAQPRVAEAAPSHVSCTRAVVSSIRWPTGVSGAASGYIRFSNRHEALLMGFEPQHWQTLRVGDHVMTCFNADPQYGCHHPIEVIDFDADFWFESSQGPEGTC